MREFLWNSAEEFVILEHDNISSLMIIMIILLDTFFRIDSLWIIFALDSRHKLYSYPKYVFLKKQVKTFPTKYTIFYEWTRKKYIFCDRDPENFALEHELFSMFYFTQVIFGICCHFLYNSLRTVGGLTFEQFGSRIPYH